MSLARAHFELIHIYIAYRQLLSPHQVLFPTHTHIVIYGDVGALSSIMINV